MNLHFNVPVETTLDKSCEYERPPNPRGPRQTTYNSRHPENNILCERKSLLIEKKPKKQKGGLMRFGEQNKFRLFKGHRRKMK